MEYVKLKDMLNKELAVRAGLSRKLADQILKRLAHEHNIRLDAVNLIVNRGLNVASEHYLHKRYWTDKLFGIYVNWLKKTKLI